MFRIHAYHELMTRTVTTHRLILKDNISEGLTLK